MKIKVLPLLSLLIFFSGRLVSGVAGMVLFVGLAFAALSLKRNVLSMQLTFHS